MALGPGKCDDLLTEALVKVKQRSPHVLGGILITYAPREHADESGFSAQLPLEGLVAVPDVLRFIADQIEADLRKGEL